MCQAVEPASDTVALQEDMGKFLATIGNPKPSKLGSKTYDPCTDFQALVELSVKLQADAASMSPTTLPMLAIDVNGIV